MTSTSPQYLKTQQLADALGVGVSTLKRWVDSGELSAARTVGRHRLISLDEAMRFARLRKLGTAGLERLADSSTSASVSIEKGFRDELIAALKKGRHRESRRVIAAAHRALGSGAAIADALIGPVMEQVGHGWRVGTWDVFEEHQASQIVSAAISEQIARIDDDGESGRPIAIGAGPEGDLYTIGLLLGELTLREQGWDVKNLGPNLPLKSLARAITSHRPRLVFLVVCHLADPVGFLDEYPKVSEAARAVGATLVVGGRGLAPEMIARLDHASHGDRMAHLEAIGRSLRSSSIDGASDVPSS